MGFNDLPDRISYRVEPEPNSGCWLWSGSHNGLGYGTLLFASRMRYAHRVIYELLVGPIENGLHLDHLCRNPSCVNPDHVEPVTPYVNWMRGEGWGAKNKRKVECVAGHPFDDANTYVNKRGHRWCRACKNARMRRYNARASNTTAA